MIKARCRTNLDGYRGICWPKSFVSLPRMGDYVEGDRGGFSYQLRVIRVVHVEGEHGPEVQVVLHK